MARWIPQRFGAVGLSIVATLLVVWPVFAQGSRASDASPPNDATDFTSFWVQTFTPTTAWSGGDADAQALGKIQMWRYLEVVGPSEGNRWPVVDPRNDARSWVDAAAVGPVGPPPDDYFAATPPDDET